MKKFLFGIAAAFAVVQAASAGAVGPWVGNMSQTGAMVYYQGGNYSRAQAAMGVQNRYNPDLLASAGNGVLVTQSIALPVGAGVAKSTLLGTISPTAVLATVGSVMGGPIGIGMVGLSVLPAVIDWFSQANTRPVVGSPGQFETLAPAGQVCEPRSRPPPSEQPYYGDGRIDSSPWVCHIKNGVGTWSFDFYSTTFGWAPYSYGVYSVPVATMPPSYAPSSWPDMQQKLSGLPVSTALINSLLDAGYKFPLDGPTVTGEASVSAPPVVTKSNSTAPNGDSLTTTRTVTKKSDQTYDNASTDPVTGNQGPSVTSNTTTSTSTTIYNNTTNTSTTSNSTTNNPTEEKADPCKFNPDLATCKTLGEAPEKEKIPELKIPVTFTPVAFAAPAACPAPYSGDIKVLTFSRHWEVKYTPMCDLMGLLRPIFLALGAAAAALIFMEGLKT